MFNIKVILPAFIGKQYNGPVIQTHYPSTPSRDGAFDNLVKYKELSIQFGTFQIQKHDSLNIKRITLK